MRIFGNGFLIGSRIGAKGPGWAHQRRESPAARRFLFARGSGTWPAFARLQKAAYSITNAVSPPLLQTNSSSPKFHVVVAYVPEEFIWCDWLHGQLDQTPVPPSLAGQRTRHGFTRPSMLRVFPNPRDPAHLARCATAIPPCRHLVVVCSPHSAKSPQLDEQIRAFKKTETEDRMIVVVVDGDPDHHDAATHVGTDWLPAWLRWRLDENGDFRQAESSEPLIIDARSGKLSLPEARAELVAALLDLPRSAIRAYDDLVSPHASATLAPPSADPADESSKRRSPTLLAAAACILLGVAIWTWWNSHGRSSVRGEIHSPDQVAAASAQVAKPIPSAATEPKLPPVETPAGTKATPHPIAQATASAAISTPREQRTESSPKAEPKVTLATATTQPPQPKPTPGSTANSFVGTATPVPDANRSRLPVRTADKTAAVFFAAAEGPQTALSPIAVPTAPRIAAAEDASNWRRLQDLGDALIKGGNRDAGLIALSQAAESALQPRSRAALTDEEQLEVARMCFRVAALQKQYFTPAETRRTISGALRLVQAVPPSAKPSAERKNLEENLNRLLESLPK